VPVERAKVDRAALAAGRARVGEPRDAGAMAAAMVGSNHSARPPACLAFQTPTISLRIRDRLALSPARLASAAACAAARSRSCARRLGQTTRDRAAADVLPLPIFRFWRRRCRLEEGHHWVRIDICHLR
jgi:hypothetical protein